MQMFFKAFFPKALCTADVTEIALSARKLVNYARHERFWKFVLKGEACGKSFWSFKNNFQFWKWENLSKAADQIVLYAEGRFSKERENHHKLHSGDWRTLFIKFVEEFKNALIHKFTRITIPGEYFLQFLHLLEKRSIRRRNHIRSKQKGGKQTSLVGVWDERLKVRINTRERIFSVHRGQKSVCFTINVNIEECEDVLVFFFVCKSDVRVLWWHVLRQFGDMLLRPKKHEYVIDVPSKEYWNERQWALLQPWPTNKISY